MKIDIWSDVRCPFCYIGKRKFETALAQFEHKDQVEVEWHSFELDPQAITDPKKNAYDYLAEAKGQSRKWSMDMHQYVTDAAAEVDLVFNFDQLIIANSFNAHRLIQLAKSLKLGEEAEEKLFFAHFTNGENIADRNTLLQIGLEIGIKRGVLEQMLDSNSFSDEVRYDENTAQQIGINGVPFFIINQKYTISGAQPSTTFLESLKQSWVDYSLKQDISSAEDTCSTDGICT